MVDVSPEAWTKEMEDARAALRERFPDLRCLRCRNERFVELICENCGLQERHIVRLLATPAVG
jgi:hypothetical protein